jgi:multiple sugar transport system substrate-binding protein
MAAAPAGCLGGGTHSTASPDPRAREFTLTIAENAIAGGKNAAGADWIVNWVIPRFVAAQKAAGRTAHVRFVGAGVGDEEYKNKIALDLKTGSGADINNIDGVWLGEFAEAGYLKPLAEMVGQAVVESWDDWAQIPPAVQGNASYQGKRYGVPAGTDGRVIYFSRALFAAAGLPADWQPRSWDDILRAGRVIKAQLPGVTPIQLNAGTAMGEATSTQGVLPLLAGAGQQIYADGKWQGDTAAMRDVLDFYQKIYRGGLGDPVLQQDVKGRDKSFQEFAAGKIAILLESDYFWRSVVEPAKGIAKMADRDRAVGYALIPAMKPGSGLRGQSFVSISGGSTRVINPATRYPWQAWELLTFMNSKEAITAQMGGSARISQRRDVNSEVLAGDEMLSFVSRDVLPCTTFRPGLAVYPRVSQLLQQATLDVVGGRSAADAAATYARNLVSIVGGSEKVVSG